MINFQTLLQQGIDKSLDPAASEFKGFKNAIPIYYDANIMWKKLVELSNESQYLKMAFRNALVLDRKCCQITIDEQNITLTYGSSDNKKSIKLQATLSQDIAFMEIEVYETSAVNKSLQKIEVKCNSVTIDCLNSKIDFLSYILNNRLDDDNTYLLYYEDECESWKVKDENDQIYSMRADLSEQYLKYLSYLKADLNRLQTLNDQNNLTAIPHIDQYEGTTRKIHYFEILKIAQDGSKTLHIQHINGSEYTVTYNTEEEMQAAFSDFTSNAYGFHKNQKTAWVAYPSYITDCNITQIKSFLNTSEKSEEETKRIIQRYINSEEHNSGSHFLLNQLDTSEKIEAFVKIVKNTPDECTIWNILRYISIQKTSFQLIMESISREFAKDDTIVKDIKDKLVIPNIGDIFKALSEPKLFLSRITQAKQKKEFENNEPYIASLNQLEIKCKLLIDLEEHINNNKINDGFRKIIIQSRVKEIVLSVCLSLIGSALIYCTMLEIGIASGEVIIGKVFLDSGSALFCYGEEGFVSVHHAIIENSPAFLFLAGIAAAATLAVGGILYHKFYSPPEIQEEEPLKPALKELCGMPNKGKELFDNLTQYLEYVIGLDSPGNQELLFKELEALRLGLKETERRMSRLVDRKTQSSDPNHNNTLQKLVSAHKRGKLGENPTLSRSDQSYKDRYAIIYDT